MVRLVSLVVVGGLLGCAGERGAQRADDFDDSKAGRLAAVRARVCPMMGRPLASVLQAVTPCRLDKNEAVQAWKCRWYYRAPDSHPNDDVWLFFSDAKLIGFGYRDDEITSCALR